MQLASDFEFKPLPPIADGQRSGPAALANPLGRLAGLAGKWTGTGFNVIWRPNSTPGQDRFLELNVTSEILEFAEIKGAIPNRGLLQSDINMFGLTYLQQITDRNLDAGLHIEPGVWVHVPKTSNPVEPVTIVRMASIPHGTTIVAQGVSSSADESVVPTIPVGSIKPFAIGAPAQTIDFPEQTLTTATKFRTPADGLVGVTQKMVNDPNSVLRDTIVGQKITETIKLHVSTGHKPVLGGGTTNTAFLTGGPAGPNALAATVAASFWLEKLEGDTEFRQLQYSQIVLLDFNGLSWPHVSVATLRKEAS